MVLRLQRVGPLGEPLFRKAQVLSRPALGEPTFSRSRLISCRLFSHAALLREKAKLAADPKERKALTAEADELRKRVKKFYAQRGLKDPFASKAQ